MVKNMASDLTQWISDFFKIDEYDELLDEVMLSVGILLFDIIVADGIITNKELEKFSAIFSTKFDIKFTSVEHLFNHIPLLQGDLSEHSTVIRNHLNKNGVKHYAVLDILNQMIIVDGVDNREYDQFYKIKHIFDGQPATAI